MGSRAVTWGQKPLGWTHTAQPPGTDREMAEWSGNRAGRPAPSGHPGTNLRHPYQAHTEPLIGLLGETGSRSQARGLGSPIRAANSNTLRLSSSTFRAKSKFFRPPSSECMAIAKETRAAEKSAAFLGQRLARPESRAKRHAGSVPYFDSCALRHRRPI